MTDSTTQNRTAFDGKTVEEVQAYWNARPCNIRHSTKEVGTREYFDEVEARKYRVEPHIPGFADFSRWRGKRVLEIGCGIGTDTINFARAGAHVTAVDLSDESLKVARMRAEVFGLQDQITFYQADAERLSQFVPPQQYDLVYSFGVIHHTPNPGNVLDQIRQHFVHDDTTVKIMVYYRLSWKVLWIIMGYGRGQFWKADQLIAEHSEAQTGSPVTYSYTRRTGAQLMADHGFTAMDLQPEHIFPYHIPSYVKYEYRKEWYWAWMPNPLFRWLERHFGWHLLIDAHPSEKVR